MAEHIVTIETVDQLKALIERWTFQRESYPGWLIANKRRRQILEDETLHYLPNCLILLDDLDLNLRLRLLILFCWRIEIALLPIDAKIADSLKSILDQIGGEKSLDDDKAMVALTLLRHYRENFDVNGWGDLFKSTQLLSPLDGFLMHRITYEQVLFHLWHIERDKARNVVNQWDVSTNSTRALLWKAGTLVELGEREKGTELLEKGLESVRTALYKNNNDIELLSYEGWMEFVLFELRVISRKRLEKSFLDERWSQLQQWDCNPKTLIVELQEPLSRPVQKHSTVNYDFDSISITQSVHSLRSSFKDSFPAFAYLRLFETTGIPFNSRFRKHRETLEAVSTWITAGFGVYFPFYLIRAGMWSALAKSTESGRRSIAQLTTSYAEDIGQSCLEIVERHLEKEVTESSCHVVRAAQEVLSRLAFRMNIEQRERSFDIALKILGNRRLKYDSDYESETTLWLMRICEDADDRQFLEWLPRLIPSTVDAKVASAFQDAVGVIIFSRLRNRTRKHLDLEQAVDKLVELIRRAEPFMANIGAERFVYLMLAKKVTKSQRLLFEKTVEVRKLTIGTSLLVHLPDFQNGFSPREASKKQVFEGFVNHYIGGARSQRTNIASQLLHCSKPTVEFCDSPRGPVVWQQDELMTIFERILEAIDKDHKLISVSPDLEFILNQDAFQYIARCIAGIIIPSLNNGQITKVLEQLNTVDRPCRFYHSIFASLASRSSGMRNRTYELIRKSMDSLDIEEQDCSYFAIRVLNQQETSDHRLLDMVEDLNQRLVYRVAFRCGRYLERGLYHLSCLIRESPSRFNEQSMRLLDSSLDAWQEVTSLGPMSIQQRSNDEAKPVQRYEVAKLTYAMRVWHNQAQLSVSSRFEKVVEELKSDVLPDVRRATDGGFKEQWLDLGKACPSR